MNTGFWSSMREVTKSRAVWVAALGYFVDLYDLVLFGVARVPSLKSLGLDEAQVLAQGTSLLNVQMAGMLLGGFVWGVAGDKLGRLRVLYGSIFVYSVANLLNAFVTDVDQYAILRFLSGVGLAGELGAAVTLVSETLAISVRGYGTAFVATMGFLGAIVSSLVATQVTWRQSYISGGALGILLLIVRLRVSESRLFHEAETRYAASTRGNLGKIFKDRRLFAIYAKCVLAGVPIWWVAGILVYLAPELARSLEVQGVVTGAQAVMWTYLGSMLGDILSSLAAQKLRSRRKAILLFMGLGAVTATIYLFFARGVSLPVFSAVLFGLGFMGGYWAQLATVAAEQFGTDLRATAATSVPNLVRATVIPLTLAFGALHPKIGMREAAGVLGAVSLGLAAWAIWTLPETIARDLDYREE